MNFKTRILLIVVCCSISARLFASQINGTVTNGTTGKPAANAEVALLSLAGGMQETGSARTDSQGKFVLNVPDEGVQHLVRVTYQGANYHKPAPQGTTSLDITVYDAARHVDNLIGEGRILRMQTVGADLEVSEMYSLRNESSPPRTQMSDQSFEIVLPEGAQITDAMAKGPGGMPVTSEPVPTGKKDHYAFVFPVRPGATQFQVVYKLPYKGSHDFAITADMPLAELGVMLPKSMAFKSAGAGFAQATDESGMTVFVAKSVATGQQLKFTVSGEGSAPQQAQEGGTVGGPPAASGSGMGGSPTTPDASNAAGLYMVGGVLVIVVGGAFLAIRKRKSTSAAHTAGAPQVAARVERETAGERTVPRPSSPSAGNMLDALKEELFQLESDRVQGKISQQEYEKAKAGLDMLMRRQMR
ncbi:MAG: carboxypeptidase-like regulatory domain-containing protein [Acidobacteriia bacterium]|nr:carboxypeptidase-like regulatory domain-containing protein [Terriglobia bacterium]